MCSLCIFAVEAIKSESSDYYVCKHCTYDIHLHTYSNIPVMYVLVAPRSFSAFLCQNVSGRHEYLHICMYIHNTYIQDAAGFFPIFGLCMYRLLCVHRKYIKIPILGLVNACSLVPWSTHQIASALMPVFGRIQRCLPQSFRQSETHMSVPRSLLAWRFFGPGRPKTCPDRLLHTYLTQLLDRQPITTTDVPIRTCDPPLSLLWIFILAFCDELFGWTWSARGKGGLDWKGGQRRVGVGCMCASQW